MNRIARWYWIARALGLGNLPHRLRYALKARSGYFVRRLPAGEPPEPERAARFVAAYRADDASARWRQRSALMFGDRSRKDQLSAALRTLIPDGRWAQDVGEQVDRLRAGEVRYFGRRFLNLGWPPRFQYDPLHDITWPIGRHWSRYHQFDPALRDIKLVWEPSRFAFAYALARDAARGGTDQSGARIGDLFWDLVRAWDTQNTFGSTVAWSNGQECAIRAMAWIFAASQLYDRATASQLHRLTELIAYSGDLIEVALDYARGQKNNHAITEAAALWTFGLLFPELESSARWRALGRRVLGEELERQVYPDGSYVQHSVIYHRVALEGALWAMWVGHRAQDRLPEIEAPVSRALEWLITMTEPTTGFAPNYGPNDGSWILPLSCTDYRDMRPTIQSLHVFLHGTRAYPAGPWDEQMLWLTGTDSLSAAVRERSDARTRAAPDGGYYPLRGDRSWGVIRAHAYRDRPTQADMLHFDWWLDGENLLRDGGSYLYYTDPPWHRWFDRTAAHNTIEVDGRDQMEPGPNFLWFRWTRARVTRWRSKGDVQFIDAEHHGYRRLAGAITHRRGILRLGDRWVVVDDVLGSGAHSIALRWRLRSDEWRLTSGSGTTATVGTDAIVTVHGGERVTLLEGAISPAIEGWESLHYAEKTPSPTLVVRRHSALPLRLVTTIRPTGSGELHIDGGLSSTAAALRISRVDPSLAETIADVTGGRILASPG